MEINQSKLSFFRQLIFEIKKYPQLMNIFFVLLLSLICTKTQLETLTSFQAMEFLIYFNRAKIPPKLFHLTDILQNYTL